MTRTEWKAEVEKQLTLRGWRRKELAEAVGLSVSHVSNTVCGSVRSKRLVEKISDVLGIEPYSE